MTELNPYLVAKTRPAACADNFITGDGYRITLLTPSLLRLEVQKDGIFTDGATQFVWFRDFPAVQKEIKRSASTLIVETSECKFNFSVSKKKLMSVCIGNSDKWVDCNNKRNLGGTCRTLDMKQGRVKVGNGVLSADGVAVLSDNGIVLNDDGTLSSRKAKEKDLYIFAYGLNFQKALDDYFYLTGITPMLPRYVFGNWWSRYYAYTQEEYLALTDRFEKENVPLTVATVDMDWHWVKVNDKFGTDYKSPSNPFQSEGWTGYSWNTDLFPDYREFLNKLHSKNLHVTLNLHPAQGIRAFEDAYPAMAEAMGINPADKKDIPFDISDNRFINAYFDVLHHPYEDEGVDFWWIDWQQGTKSTLKDVDPLWALNHYHYLDNARNGRRGLILSRYCGIGAHRYPLGFSGDYIIKWKSLAFQPEFTNTSSNIGYSWWSHDIGGHAFGYCDDEMYLRWCQYGVFSPINRLHSTSFPLQGKEPWKRSETVKRITCDFLRLRHALIPYIYTASYFTHKNNIALCRPMYYVYSDLPQAYSVPNQYFFGSELIVCPVTERVNGKINMAKVKVWLPEGRYTDFFTGQIYEGGRTVTMSRDLEYIPVLAKEGAIIPLSADAGNSCDNPVNLDIYVYRGNNSYTLYEDDGISEDYKNGVFALTEFTVKEEGKTLYFRIMPVKGDVSVIPKNRKYTVCFRDVKSGEMFINGEKREFSEKTEVDFDPGIGAEIVINETIPKDNGDCFENVNMIFSRWQGSNLGKMIKYYKLDKIRDKEKLRKAIKKSLFIPRCVKAAALEKLL